MRKQFFTPSGIIERELTQQEIEELASQNNTECKKEIAKQKLSSAVTVPEQLEAIKEFLGLK